VDDAAGGVQLQSLHSATGDRLVQDRQRALAVPRVNAREPDDAPLEPRNRLFNPVQRLRVEVWQVHHRRRHGAVHTRLVHARDEQVGIQAPAKPGQVIQVAVRVEDHRHSALSGYAPQV
jgi:hypothetical protein